MCSRPFRPLGLPIYVARVPAAPFSLLPSSLYLLCRYPIAPLKIARCRLHSTFAIEFYLARALEDEIKLLRDLVIVPLCPASRGDARFRKALVLNGRIRAIENERIAEPSFVIKDAWAERFWTVIVFKDAATRGATEAQVSLAILCTHVGW